MTAFFIIIFMSQLDSSYCSIYILINQFLRSIYAFAIGTTVFPTQFCWFHCLLLLLICWIHLINVFYLVRTIFMFCIHVCIYISVQINNQTNKYMQTGFRWGTPSPAGHKPSTLHCLPLNCLPFFPRRSGGLGCSLRGLQRDRAVDMTVIVLLNWHSVIFEVSTNFSAFFCCWTYCLNIWQLFIFKVIQVQLMDQ